MIETRRDVVYLRGRHHHIRHHHSVVVKLTRNMPACAAYWCKKDSWKDRDLTFFRFPSNNPVVLRQWIHNSGRGNASSVGKKWTPSRYSVMCSSHFEEDCFELDYFNELVGSTTAQGRRRRRRLKPGTVPTIFQNVSKGKAKREAKPRLLSLKRAAKSNHEAVPIIIIIIPSPRARQWGAFAV